MDEASEYPGKITIPVETHRGSGYIKRVKRGILLATLLFVFQVSVTSAAWIRGTVIDAITGAPVQGAEVRLFPSDIAFTTGNKGRFLFRKIGFGRYSLDVKAAGYQPAGLEKIDIRKNDTGVHTYRIALQRIIYEAKITVKADTLEMRFKDIMETEIPAELLKDEPGALEDPVKKVQTLPGVVGESDFLSLLYVRGGSANETMLFLDRSYLLNPYHLGGAFTVYFEDLIDKVEFYTGGFPARYGNALSGVLDITYRSGDRKRLSGMTDFSPISAKLRFEGPLNNGKSSFLIAARRSYWDFAVKLLNKSDDIAAPYFGDVFGKYTYFGDSRRISFEALYGEDGIQRFELDESLENPKADPGTFYFLNKNKMVNTTWEEWLGPEWSATGTLAFSRSATTADLTGTEPLFANAVINFMMTDIAVDHTTDVWRLSGGIQAGWAELKLDSFLTDYRSTIDGARKMGNENLDKTDLDFDKPFQFQGLWSEAQWAPNWDRLMQVSLGMRADRWADTNEITWAPRLNLLMGLTDRIRLIGGAGIFYQFPYNMLQTAEGYGNPDLKSERAKHLILGFEGDVSSFLKLRIEGFYKWYDRSIVNHDTPEKAYQAALEGKSFVNEGKGFAYGGELFCQLFPWKIFDGWFTYSYTLVKVHNPLNIENPQWYYPLQDQRHTLHLILDVHPFRNWIISGRLSYYTGRPDTEITDWSLQLDKDPPHYPIWVAQYGSLNAARMPSYFRLDFRVQWMKRFSKGLLAIHLDLMNATNRKNLYVNSYDSGNPPKIKPERDAVYNLPLLPIIGVIYRF